MIKKIGCWQNVYLCPVSQSPASLCLPVELQKRVGPPQELHDQTQLLTKLII